MSAVVGEVKVLGNKVYCTVNKGGTIETMEAPRRWWRRLQLALITQTRELSLQEVRDFCDKHAGLLLP